MKRNDEPQTGLRAVSTDLAACLGRHISNGGAAVSNDLLPLWRDSTRADEHAARREFVTPLCPMMSKLDAKSLARIRFRLTSLLTVLSARLMTERTFHLPTVE